MRITKIFTCCLYLLAVAALMTFSRAGLAKRDAPEQPNANAQDFCALPPHSLPSEIGSDAYQALLSKYVTPPPCINNPNGAECNKCYSNLDAPNCKPCYRKNPGWKADSQIRDTGFFIGDNTLGTHKAVKVYYSPEVWTWLNNGRKEDDIADGAMIVKEMYSAPAPLAGQPAKFRGLAIMVRDKKGSWDGWFWSDGAPCVNDPNNRRACIDYSSYPNAGFGLYCVNCHASAKTDLTFAALRNITGDPLTFNTTMPPNQINVPTSSGRRGMLESRGIAPQMQLTQEKDSGVHSRRARGGSAQQSAKIDAQDDTTESVSAQTPKQLVSQWYDHVTQPPQSKGRQMFLTSTQCIGCHDATQNNDSMPNMIYPQIYNQGSNQTELDLNVSPYGELRSSMMGLSGRDPVFYAQLETEIKLHPEIKDEIVNTCMSCHGVMGKRQIDLDKKGPFRLEYLDLKAPDYSSPPNSYAQYGALARDGVSCAVCHHISAEGLGTPATYTGKFKTGKVDEIFGPFEDVVTVPMKNSLGLTPRRTKEDQIRSSALCGSCHTVILPVLNVGQKYPPNVFDDPKQRTGHEQETYWEWLNSKYQNERPPINPATKQSCQDCHMPAQYPSKTGNRLLFKMASIEEDTFATADFRAPDEDIHLRVRGNDVNNPYSRHTLLGMNVFVLGMFNQFNDSLGISIYDPMAPGSAVPGLFLGMKSALDLARNEAAQIEITSLQRTPKGLNAQVKITNLTGHKFPSGVSFRRAFIEFKVTDANGKVLWVSGRTDAKGVIQGAPDARTGKTKALLTEYFDKESNPKQIYQPHYDTAPGHIIDSQDKVQIYEELVKDSDGNFTTSFLSLADSVKDNRIMPQGWREGGPNWEDTLPHGVDKATNPGYFNESGTSVVAYQVFLPAGTHTGQPLTVTATIYYQTIPPYYQRQRFWFTPEQPFTKSLKYYVDNLIVDQPLCWDTSATAKAKCKLLLPDPPMKDWRLFITSTSKKL
jgi:cytochrome c553